MAAILTMPDRAGPALGETMNCTRPSPVPENPVSIVIQLAVLAAVHVHGPSTITSRLPRPPFASKSCGDGGAITQLHGDDWLTVSVWPATLSGSERRGPLFAATVKESCAGPEPDVCERLNHAAPLAAFHGQPAAVDSDSGTVCAAGVKSKANGVTLKVQPLGCEIETV